MLLWYELESEVKIMEDNIIASFSRNKSASLDFVNKYETVNIDNCKVGDTLYIKPLFNFEFKYLSFEIDNENSCDCDKHIIIHKYSKSVFHTKEYKIIDVSLPLIQVENINTKRQKWINPNKFDKRLFFENREIPNSGVKLNFSLLKAQCGIINESEVDFK